MPRKKKAVVDKEDFDSGLGTASAALGSGIESQVPDQPKRDETPGPENEMLASMLHTMPLGASGTVINRGLLSSHDLNVMWANMYQRWLLIEEMIETSPQINAALMSVKLPQISTGWNFKIPDDINVSAAEMDEIEKAKSFCDEAFGTQLDVPLSTLLLQILSFNEWGFSMFEKVHKMGKFTHNGKTQDCVWYRQIAQRLAKTLYKFNVDAFGDCTSVVQRVWLLDADGKGGGVWNDVEIPADYLSIHTMNKRGADITGISVLRTVYRSYYIWDKLVRIDAMAHERYGMGVPIIKRISDANVDTEIGKKMIRLLEMIRAHEKQAMYLPFGYEFEFAKMDTRSISPLDSMIYHDELIMLNVLANFLYLGRSKTGSRALGETFSEIFLNSLNAQTRQIAYDFNKNIVEPILDLNFDLKYYPYLEPISISAIDYEKLSRSMVQAQQAGVLTPDDRIEGAYRDIAGLPSLKPGERRDADTQPKIPNKNSGISTGNSTGLKIPNAEADVKTSDSQDKEKVVAEREMLVVQAATEMAIDYNEGRAKYWKYPKLGKLEARLKSLEIAHFGVSKNPEKLALEIAEAVKRAALKKNGNTYVISIAREKANAISSAIRRN